VIRERRRTTHSADDEASCQGRHAEPADARQSALLECGDQLVQESRQEVEQELAAVAVM
jgi:hypothetical protein